MIRLALANFRCYRLAFVFACMSNEHPSKRRVDFRDLNWFGKTVYLGGAAVRLTANLVDATIDRASRIAVESRDAFERELDPQIEDARVIEEYSEQPGETEDQRG